MLSAGEYYLGTCLLSFPNIGEFRKYCENEISREKEDRTEFKRMVHEDDVVHRPVTEQGLFG